MNNIKSQIEDIQTKIKELRTKKREEKLQKLQSQYDKLTSTQDITHKLPTLTTENIQVLFNKFFTKTDDPTDTIALKLIWDTIKTNNTNTQGRDAVYKYVRELVNAPKHTSKKAEIIKGIRLISI